MPQTFKEAKEIRSSEQSKKGEESAGAKREETDIFFGFFEFFKEFEVEEKEEDEKERGEETETDPPGSKAVEGCIIIMAP